LLHIRLPDPEILMRLEVEFPNGLRVGSVSMTEIAIDGVTRSV